MQGIASSGTSGRKASRLLAALDNPSALFDDVPHAGSKHPLDTPPGSRTPEHKRRATRRARSRADSPDSPTPDPFDVDNLIQLAGLPSTQPKSTPGKIISGDFSIRYDMETEVRAIDRGGTDQALHMAEFVTKAIDNVAHGLSVQKAMEYLRLEDKRDLLPGMEVRLLPHQMIGVSWMLQQEKDTKYGGGILADDMGLGKTVQMIATMAMNIPNDDDAYRTTLIVVPAALLLQWKEEIESKTNGVFDVHIQHGKDKLKKTSQLKQKDVVITTYQTLNTDFTPPSGLDSDDELEWLQKKGGPLARMKWYRVICDEAQFIRNRGTRSSKSCAMLRAKHRWCLTGTPITNSLADIYGLMRFGHWRPWNDWHDFNEYIAKVQLEDAPLAGLRAQEILKPLLLRRTKDAELEGEPILQLPEKDVELVRLEFSEDERQLYNHIEKKAQIQINKFIRQGTIVKNSTVVLVMILRLRQLCCHPNLVLSVDDDDPSLAMASVAEKERARANTVMGVKWVIDMKRKFLKRALDAQADLDDEDLQAEEGSCPVCGEMFVNDSGRVLACGDEVCADCCRELAAAAIVHDGIFGYGDEKENLRIEKEFEAAAAKGFRPCPTCKKMNDLRSNATFASAAFQPTFEELQIASLRQAPALPKRTPGPSQSSSRFRKKPVEDFPMELDDSSDSDLDLPDPAAILRSKMNAPKDAGKGKEKAKKSSRDDEDSGISMADIAGTNATQEPSKALFATWAAGGANVEPSAKMLALIGFLQEWESTGDKTICFSQWTSMLDLVDTLFARYGIQSLRYDGSMTREQREGVLAKFRKTGGPKVILISIKCGGVGLNLTSANRIVNLDLSWNYASESQAYDRVHRLGQEKEVVVKRLVVNNTLEERMLKLQDTKTGLAETALGEGTGIKLHKLSVKELKDLFGLSKNNDNEDPNQTRLR